MPARPLFSHSPQPLYLQAAALFRSHIQNRTWRPGQQIPPLEALMETYGISRATIRQALGQLEQDGLIRRSRGSGTFVNADLPETPTLLIPKTWAETVELSNQLGTVSLVESSADSPLPDTLGMPCAADRGGRFQYLRRVHTTEAGPFCYSEVFLESSLFRKHRARISEARQVLNVTEAGQESAESLRIPVSSPVAELRRYACIDGRVVYFARLEFPFRKVRMEFDLLSQR